ncbi:MAG: heavy metal sensor histidine kinase [Planctomycetes bacterium]|nr:heavy metal sensor histidine kinase [Planctomycetota bacterium]
MSVRARLALQFTALTGVILGVFCLSLYLWVQGRWGAELDRHLQTQRRELNAFLRHEYEEIRQGVHSGIGAELQDFSAAGDTQLMVRAADGTTIYGTPGFAPVIRGDRAKATMNGLEYRGIVDTLTMPDGRQLEIIVAVGEGILQRHLHQLKLYFALFCPLVLLLSWIVGYLFVGRALAPVEQMRLQAERISRENLSERVPEPRATGEFQKLARTFNEMLDRLDRAFQDLQQFAADAAHELRTPLANLRAQIETVIQEQRAPEEYERMLESVAEDVARMTRIVTDLFTLARLDMRQYALQKERVELSPLLAEARDTWQSSAQQRGIRVTLTGGDAVVAGDPVALRRVFMNLVENAVKYNRDGGSIDLSVERADGKVRVRVRDSGIGIPAEHVPQLFRRFYRIDKARSRETGGAGLGLAICRSFVEAHEGKIFVSSIPGEGTTFTVELPALAGS